MSFMLDEIRSQPVIVERLAGLESAHIREIAAEIKKRNISNIMMAARGTSDHAAYYGKYLFEIKNAIPVSLADPSIFTLYSASLKLDNCLVIGVSQSGMAQDVAEYLANSKRMGAMTIGITNEEDSDIVKVADHTILCHADKENAVAATKTYTATLAVFYMLSAALAGEGGFDDKLAHCAQEMVKALDLYPWLEEKSQRYRYMQSGAVISRGFNYCTALETSLKLAETSYVAMRGYSAADFLHGPIASVHEGDPCFLIAPAGKAYDSINAVALKLRERGAETIVISSESEILWSATIPVGFDAKVDEDISPLLYVIPGQLLAYYLSVARGNDPDNPKGLSKVTITR